jgi:hypothetical protein
MVVELPQPLADAHDFLDHQVNCLAKQARASRFCVVVYRDNSSKGVTLIRNSGPLGLVPTTRRRHSVTETDDLTGALDEVARRRPNPGSAAIAFDVITVLCWTTATVIHDGLYG